jgi:hypothetical protein
MKAAILIAVLLLPAAAHARSLRSPRDAKNVKLTDVGYACPAIHSLPPDLTTDRFYSDSKSSRASNGGGNQLGENLRCTISRRNHFEIAGGDAVAELHVSRRIASGIKRC